MLRVLERRLSLSLDRTAMGIAIRGEGTCHQGLLAREVLVDRGWPILVLCDACSRGIPAGDGLVHQRRKGGGTGGFRNRAWGRRSGGAGGVSLEPGHSEIVGLAS